MIRPSRPSDLNFIKSSWFKSFSDSPLARSLPRSVFRKRWSALIDRITAGAKLLVDCDEDADDVIYGWACFEDDVLHYVFVRSDFRRDGRATRLLEAAGNPRFYSHRTTDWERVANHWLDARRVTPLYDPVRAWVHFAEAEALPRAGEWGYHQAWRRINENGGAS